jgi:hypothetical protein
MNTKTITAADQYISSKRIEALLEEVIFQLIVLRSDEVEDANEKFDQALKDVSNSVQEMMSSLPDSKP